MPIFSSSALSAATYFRSLRHLPTQRAKAALALACSFTAVSAMPLLGSKLLISPAQAQAVRTFSDVSDAYWAEDYITALADRGILSGFPDGSFRPNEPVTRAQYAAMVEKAFPESPRREAIRFQDVTANFWAAPAIQTAYQTGFLSGYPEHIFRPEQQIPRVQVLVSLANGLNYAPRGSVDSTLGQFQDRGAIPSYARNSIAAASENQLVVNYPNVDILAPNQTATRAEVSAFIYQALAGRGEVSAIASPYLAGETMAQAPFAITIPAGTTFPVRYDKAEKIYLAPDEPNPVPLTLTLSQDLRIRNGRVLIPAGSTVVGELRNEEGGARFYGERLSTPDSTSYRVEMVSDLITETETIRSGINAGRVVRDAAIGAGAAAILAGVTGDRQIEAKEVLGGAAAGAVTGVFVEKNSAELLVIQPDQDLDLTVERAFEVE